MRLAAPRAGDGQAPGALCLALLAVVAAGLGLVPAVAGGRAYSGSASGARSSTVT